MRIKLNSIVKRYLIWLQSSGSGAVLTQTL